MLENIFKKIKMYITSINNDRINQSAAECSYYVVLSFIPFIILLLSLIQYTNINSEEVFEILKYFLPSNINEIIIQIIKEAYSKSIGTISISIVFTVISAGKGLYSLTKELNQIYKCNQLKNKWIHLRIITIFKTVFFVVVIFLILIMFVFGKTLISTLESNLKMIPIFNDMFYQIIFCILAFIVFVVIYKVIPNHKVRIRSQIKGAFFSSILLNIVSFIFSQYLNIFKGFSYTYGSLTTLMLILIWTYMFFYVIFLGAEINMNTTNFRKEFTKTLANR